MFRGHDEDNASQQIVLVTLVPTFLRLASPLIPLAVITRVRRRFPRIPYHSHCSSWTTSKLRNHPVSIWQTALHLSYPELCRSGCFLQHMFFVGLIRFSVDGLFSARLAGDLDAVETRTKKLVVRVVVCAFPTTPTRRAEKSTRRGSEYPARCGSRLYMLSHGKVSRMQDIGRLRS